jgi:hypothetical protein
MSSTYLRSKGTLDKPCALPTLAKLLAVAEAKSKVSLIYTFSPKSSIGATRLRKDFFKISIFLLRISDQSSNNERSAEL